MTQLTSIVVPDSVTYLGNQVFDGNVSLMSIRLPDNLKFIGTNAFSRNYSLTRIEYCGKLTGFPIAPICPPDRQAIIDKAAADKAAAEKAASDAAARAAAELLAKQEADARAAAAARAAALKKITITCVKGKLIKKVTAVKPVCPSGYKKK
jgi:hypothetical protein